MTDFSGLTRKKSPRNLRKRLKSSAGRNSQGRITVRHQGGGKKRLFRVIDFKQNKLNIPGKIETIEYDPYRTAFIALVVYKDGERRYILAPEELKAGAEILTSEDAPFEIGMRTPLRRIPVGSFVYNIEIFPGRGGSIARSAGNFAQILANENKYTHLKMPSSEVRKVFSEGYASIGKVSNPEHALTVIGKAGRSRWLGIRPTVRGSAMNPRDHPYGGGEGKTQRGTRKPKTKWGKVTGGRKTRKKKNKSNKMIIKRRK